MIPYASNTGTRRNLAALRANGWRLLLTPDNATPRDGLRFAIDNGAFAKDGFKPEPFRALVDRLGAAADFVVLPDIVAGGADSLSLSVSWIPRLRGIRSLLLPIQDGMTAHDVGMVLRQNVQVGLFLGGSTEFKLREIYGWGMVAHAWKRYYHVGRVNTARRIRLAAEAGADSFDGTSATRYACTLPLLEAARQQPSLITPRLMSIGAPNLQNFPFSPL
jgi:hypothetical protein